MGDTKADLTLAESIGHQVVAGAEHRPPGAERMLAGLQSRMFGAAQAPSLGRFVIERRLGAGGMGVVYAAHDPKLRRTVALKVLHAASAEHLLREAQAMAKVHHPNLVTVFDVGTHEGEVFVAMEYVEGTTLRRWLADRPTLGWREILGAFVPAIDGLRAAHAAGIIHRDFKPDNVLVTEGGGVKVADFGLARPLRDPTRTDDAPDDGDPNRSRLTGTPAYMAPEQIAGEPGDARTDQFSFSVALYEALCGERPFVGANVPQLYLAISTRPPTPLPTKTRAGRLPGWLRRAVIRGLSRDPADRYPDLDALSAALRGGLARRRRVVGTSAAIAAVAAGVLAGARAGDDGAASVDCQASTAALRGVWGDARRDAIRAAFTATGVTYADDAWSRVDEVLGDHARAWSELRVGVCEATHIRGSQSAASLDLQMRCLDRRLTEMAAVVDVLSGADATTVAHAVEVASGLTPVQGCEDVEVLASVTPLPEDVRVRDEVAAIRGGLARARATVDAGAPTVAWEAIQALREDAEGIDYAPLQAEIEYGTGTALAQVGDPAKGLLALENGFVIAQQSGHDFVAAACAMAAAYVEGVSLHRPAAGRRWTRIALALAHRSNAPPALEAKIMRNRAAVAMSEGDFEAARDELRRVLTMQRQTLGAAHFEVARTLSNLAALERRQGHTDAALERYDEATAIFVSALGEDHPDTVRLHNNIGAALLTAGRLEPAKRRLRLAIEAMGKNLPPDHPSMGHPHNNLGEALAGLGEYDAALGEFETATAIWNKAFGDVHPLVAHVATERGRALLAMGRASEAATTLEQGLAAHGEAANPASEAATLLVLAKALEAQGRHAAALDRARQAEATAPAGSPIAGELTAWLATKTRSE